MTSSFSLPALFLFAATSPAVIAGTPGSEPSMFTFETPDPSPSR